MKQLTLFGEEAVRPAPKKKSGGSANPIIFRDYESFVAKFSDKPKTTDDCYTPQDVFEAVVDYVRKYSEFDFKPDTPILRPFYPGGDYINADYPEDGVVIDNPPFSMFTKICKFYTQRAKELGIKYQTPCHGVGDCEFEARQAATEMAEWMLSNQWVSVEDELPPPMSKKEQISDRVIVHTSCDSVFVDNYDHYFNRWLTAKRYDENVTHWMPIPPLAEEGGEK